MIDLLSPSMTLSNSIVVKDDNSKAMMMLKCNQKIQLISASIKKKSCTPMHLPGRVSPCEKYIQQAKLRSRDHF